MSGLEIKASVIIPSFNGARKINHLLDSLLKQTAHEFEIIVVIDGSTDHTIDILSPYHKAFRKFKVILQNNQGRSRCRNNGAKAASADILIFYDDDMIPASDSVEKHLNFHSQFLGILCGDVVEIFGANVSDLQNYKAWLTAKWTSKYAGDFTKMTRSKFIIQSIPLNPGFVLFVMYCGMMSCVDSIFYTSCKGRCQPYDIGYPQVCMHNVRAFDQKNSKSVYPNLDEIRLSRINKHKHGNLLLLQKFFKSGALLAYQHKAKIKILFQIRGYPFKVK